MNGFYRVLIAALISAVVGCTSAPIRYYTLTPPTDATAPAPKASIIIDVRVAHVPSELNRTELTVRTGPSEVALLDNERWASPVKDEIKDALRLQLQSRLGAETDLRAAIATLTVTLDVQHFEAELGRHALIEAIWSIAASRAGAAAEDGHATTCTLHADEQIAGGYAAIASGYQKDIDALAHAVVAELKRRMSGIGAPCGEMSGR